MIKEIGIYIHIPFCPSKCMYCDFYSVTDFSLAERYVNELLREIQLVAPRHKNNIVRTLYFGGGTPSALPAILIEKIVNQIANSFHFFPLESTIELNPGSSHQMKDYLKMGFDRVSVGFQSANDSVLNRFGRVHTAKEGLKTLADAAEIFPKVSADLILGTNVHQDFAKTCNIIMPFINHISAYLLTVEPSTPLKKMLDIGDICLLNEDDTVEEYNTLYEYCKAQGFYRYEVSNFAKLGMESKHNTSCWNMGQYIGMGTAAHSYALGVRYQNPSDITRYLQGEHSGNDRAEIEREYSIDAEKSETVMLALRTTAGLNVSEYNRKYQTNFFAEKKEELHRMKDYLLIRGNRVAIHPEYFLIQNQIVSLLM